MKLSGLLLTTALVTACGDSAKDTNATAAKGGSSPSAPVVPAPQPVVDSTVNPVTSYIHASDPVTNKLFADGDTGRSSLVDPAMIHPSDALFSAEEVAKEMPEENVVVHSLADLSTDERLAHADANNPVFYDIAGNNGSYNKAYLDADMKITAFAASLADIELRKGAAFDATALFLENSIVSLDKDSKTQLGALFVDKGSNINGDGSVEQHPVSEDAHGMVFEVLAKERNDFAWAEEGKFIVDGSMERLTVKNGMTLTSKDSTGNIGSLVLDGGIIALKASTPFEVGSLFVNSGSTFNFGWDAPKIQTVLAVKGNSSTAGDLKINLTELGADVVEGSTIQLVGFGGSSAKGFIAGDMFGAKVTLDIFESGVKLTLDSRKLNAELNGAARQLAQKALSSPLGSKLAVMDAGAAAMAFEGATAESTLNNRISTVNFSDLHATLAESKVGVVSAVAETASKTTQSTGYAFSNGLVLAFSATEDEAGKEVKKKKDGDNTELLGLHFSKGGFFLDMFASYTSAQKSFYGVDVSYKLRGFDLGMNYNHGTNSCETNSVIGDVRIPKFHHDSANVYVGFSRFAKQLDGKPVKISSKVGFDVYSSISSHTTYLNGYAFGMDAYSPLKSVAAEVAAELPFSIGCFQVSYGVRSNGDFTGQFGALRFKFEM